VDTTVEIMKNMYSPDADYEKMKNPLSHPLSEFGIILVQL
jgi:hypothetical protein